MHEDPRTEPLREWNRLARENAENAIVSSMLEAGGVTSEPVDGFATWLLVGAGAVAGFMVANADKVIPILSKCGFLVCGSLLLASCLFGVVSKVFALRVRVTRAVGQRVRETFAEHLVKHEQEQQKIDDGAKFWGITLESGIRMERVLQEFYKPLPPWVKWLSERHLNKYKGNPQLAYIPLAKLVTAQGVTALVQALLFIGALAASLVYAAAA